MGGKSMKGTVKKNQTPPQREAGFSFHVRECKGANTAKPIEELPARSSA
jgi:hypothetical protein